MPSLRELHRMLYEPNTEGRLDGLRWTGYPGLFIQTRSNNQSWLLRWKREGKTRVMGLGSCSKVTPRCQWAAKFPRLWAFNFPWFGGFGFDR